MAFFVPPGGFAGLRQQAPAVRNTTARATGTRMGTTTKRKRRRKGKRKAKSKYGGGGMSAVKTKGIRGRGKSPYSRRMKRKSKGPKFGSPAFNKKHGVGQYAKR